MLRDLEEIGTSLPMTHVVARERHGLPCALGVPKSEYGERRLCICKARTAVTVQDGQSLYQAGLL